jgi:DsbC/DsbD-like thiol-disulfide interchange protein
MNKIVLCFLAIFMSAGALAQQPYHWEFTAKKTADKTYEIHLTAEIDNGWHTYSQTTPDGGPLPTKISFGKNPLVTRIRDVDEVGKMEKYHESVFDVDVKRYSDKVDFVQVVKLKAAVKTVVNGTVEFMFCNDHECLPPKTLPFSISLN